VTYTRCLLRHVWEAPSFIPVQDNTSLQAFFRSKLGKPEHRLIKNPNLAYANGTLVTSLPVRSATIDVNGTLTEVLPRLRQWLEWSSQFDEPYSWARLAKHRIRRPLDVAWNSHPVSWFARRHVGEFWREEALCVEQVNWLGGRGMSAECTCT
jgi:hypothetical protein